MLRITLLLMLVLLNACSINKMTVRATMPMVEGGMQALYREDDLLLAESAFGPNIELMEGMLINDPANQALRQYAAQAYYGYAFGFVEEKDGRRAGKLYRRGMRHGLQALQHAGLAISVTDSTLKELEESVARLDKSAVPALFWTASCWAKWIDMNRDDVAAIGDLPRAAMLMEKVLELDEGYFLGGPHIFMGVYHGGRSPMLGGNFQLSAQHFDRARELTKNKLLVINVLQAQYLERQKNDKETFRNLLTAVLDAPDDLYPEQALANTMAKARALKLLEKELQWF